ncbi:MAG: glycosyltransferase family 4 protein [Magnetococcales bacterium]|nr:glycosyltransferase family 4 protein [Magnetococcales bacterium]
MIRLPDTETSLPPSGHRPLRLAMLLPSMRRAGAESVVAMLCRHLARAGCEVHLVVAGLRCEYHEELAGSGVGIHFLDLYQGPIRFWRPDRHWRIRARLGALLAELAPEVVHCHLYHGLTWGGQAARKAGARVFYTAHGLDPWLVGTDLASRWRRYRFVRALAQSDCRMVAVSRTVADHQAGWLGVDPASIAVLPNPIETDLWHPGARIEHPRRVIMAGTLYPLKRVQVGLRAMRLLAAAEPEAELWIAGDGPERANLEREAVGLGIRERVTFLGVRRDLPGLLRAVGAMWLLSEREGMPMVALEAMASGLPLVASAVPGTTDLARHEENALLVPLDDPEAVAQATLRLWREAGIGARIRAGGMVTASQHEASRAAQAHLALYHERHQPQVHSPTNR